MKGFQQNPQEDNEKAITQLSLEKIIEKTLLSLSQKISNEDKAKIPNEKSNIKEEDEYEEKNARLDIIENQVTKILKLLSVDNKKNDNKENVNSNTLKKDLLNKLNSSSNNIKKRSSDINSRDEINIILDKLDERKELTNKENEILKVSRK